MFSLFLQNSAPETHYVAHVEISFRKSFNILLTERNSLFRFKIKTNTKRGGSILSSFSEFTSDVDAKSSLFSTATKNQNCNPVEI